ncbi:hypothetical protein N7456_000371 [Penicillium angulare]|uniref:Dynamin n=1 Tax=Penicillium angulare TaxID=116970 RepID=A0A9W9GBW2_9EURO|nr:hypothetical protein N7456_000371 [Penicillium angulare]
MINLFGLLRPSKYFKNRLPEIIPSIYLLNSMKEQPATNLGRDAALADPILLEKIDKLFACNVGEYISLPQLVVVGDQSSGKSSVLEALTKLSFPRDSGLCTRFATQIIFRRKTSLIEREISASIIPESGLSSEDEQRLREWKSSGIQTLFASGFVEMMKGVHEAMGLSTSDGDGKPIFSKSVLCLEICGPQEDHLSVIDVPGIFKNTTGRTTKADISLVRTMVERYMSNPRSIMLTVVPANVDIATQEIIEMALEVDPAEERTLKILTKPDLVDKGAEKRVIDLIEEGNASGKLGWILVRNLGQQQLDEGKVDRDLAEEIFYKTAPWNQVSIENFGIKTLKIRLQEVLTTNVRRVFPEVRAELARMLQRAKSDIDSLGMTRQTSEQQRGALLNIAWEFRKLTQDSLRTNYGTSDTFKEHALRLATIAASRNSKFSEDMAIRGHKYLFQVDQKNDDESASDKENNGSSVNKVSSRKDKGHSDVEEILHDPIDVERPVSGGIHKWIQTIHEESRGFEIGTFNYSLLSTLMKEQSSKWPAITQGYISDMISMVHRFIQRALDVVCKDKNIAMGIMANLMDDLMYRYQESIVHVDFLLRIERDGTPMTLNHYLNDNLQKCRQKRVTSTLSPMIVSSLPNVKVVRLSDIMQQNHMSNEKHAANDIHDILQSYYKVARKRFVDAVCMQAADYHLVTGPMAPMNLLSVSWVNSLSNEKLAEIAGEDPKTQRKRRQLLKEVNDLEAGRKVLSG